MDRLVQISNSYWSSKKYKIWT